VYGAYKYNGKRATFDQMLETQYAVTQIKGRATDIKCDNAQFGDPLPGTRKGCFCDDVGALTDDKIGADLAYFHNQYQVEQDKLLQEQLQMQMAAEAQANQDRLAAIEAYKQEMTAQYEAEQAADAAWAE
jgi:hypothetical protein